MHRVFNLKETLTFKNWEITDKNPNFLASLEDLKILITLGSVATISVSVALSRVHHGSHHL